MTDNNQTANHRDQSATLMRLGGYVLPERLWTTESLVAEEPPADHRTGLVSLKFIRSAIRRGARFWCITAVLGLLVGCGLYVTVPPSYQASASVLLTFGPYENANTAALDNQAIAQSHAVAGLALKRMGLRQDAGTFLGTYTATVVSNRVLMITVSAPSISEAVTRANAVAAAFLTFRATQLESEQRLVLNSLAQQISEAQRSISMTKKQISLLPAQPTSSAQQAELSRLQARLSQSNIALTTAEQTAGGQANSATALAVKGSEILDTAAPLPHSRLKRLLLYPIAGLILGLALGMAIVAIRALISDRLRRRDDVARALGAPVKLSVGAVRGPRWRPGRRRVPAAQNPQIQRIAAHLASAVPAGSHGPATLAVVPVDDPQTAALSVVSLAVTQARQGKQVIVADLCSGAPGATLLGAENPGVSSVSVSGAHLTAVVPDRDDVAPVGPLAQVSPEAEHSPFAQAVAANWVSADLLLILTTLDPSLGCDHLTTWTADAVAVVTAGKASASRIHAASEMLRLAGIRLISAVLVGADRNDDSLGTAQAPAYPAVQGT